MNGLRSGYRACVLPADPNPEPEFSVTTTADGDALVIAVAGQADLHTAPELRSTIGQALDAGRYQLVVDLTETTFIDSMTLGVLLGALKRLKPQSGRMAIVCPDPHLRRVFEITSLDRVLDLSDSREGAVTRVLSAPAGGVP